MLKPILQSVCRFQVLKQCVACKLSSYYGKDKFARCLAGTKERFWSVWAVEGNPMMGGLQEHWTPDSLDTKIEQPNLNSLKTNREIKFDWDQIYLDHGRNKYGFIRYWVQKFNLYNRKMPAIWNTLI